MKVSVYNSLPNDAVMIRQKVFIEEQGFKDEFDNTDKVASHIVMYNENDEPIATCRVFEDRKKGGFIFGRLAVIESYRGMNIGTKIIREAERLVVKMGGTSISLHAQCRVRSFYEKSGYIAYGAIENEEGCPHIWMTKQL